MDRKNRYARKSYGSVYRWSPDRSIKKTGSVRNDFTLGCSAVPGSLGEDWDTSYVYDVEVIDGITHKIAYVECGYVA